MSATGTNSPTLTYAQAKDRKKRRTITHPVVTDDDAVVAYQAATEALTKARGRALPADKLGELERARDEAKQAVRDATLVFKLRALPRKGEHSYTALKAEHPPTPEDDAEVRESTGNDKARALYHQATFQPALVAACLIEPQVTVEEATEMAAEWNDAEWYGLVYAAIAVNEQATNTAGLVFS